MAHCRCRHPATIDGCLFHGPKIQDLTTDKEFPIVLRETYQDNQIDSALTDAQ